MPILFSSVYMYGVVIIDNDIAINLYVFSVPPTVLVFFQVPPSATSALPCMIYFFVSAGCEP